MNKYIKNLKTIEADVYDMMERFDYAYQKALVHYERMERIQKAYDNQISTYNWPTISEISIPLTFISVEEQLPYVMKYLFPDSRFIELIPAETKMDYETVRKVEDSLKYTILYEMNAMQALFPSIKDCYKYGVGYGLVDVKTVTPQITKTNKVFKNGKEMASRKIMAKGTEKVIPCYKYISPIQVVPMPDGAEVEGTNSASGHFVIEFLKEDEFRSLYESQKRTGEKMLKGDVEKIIAEAKVMKFDDRLTLADKISVIAGLDMYTTNNNTAEMPCVVPVVRCYFPNHHMWIANGTTKIYEQKDNFQSLRSDLIKWSAWPDGMRWFPMNVTEASERLAQGVNIWYNGMIDLAMYSMNPTRVINESALAQGQKSLQRGPASDIRVKTNARDAVSYLELPQFPQQLFTMGDILGNFHGKANSIASFVDRGQAGLVRSGANALESLLSTYTGRQMLAGMILKTGGMKPFVEKVIIKRQLLVDEAGDRFIDIEYDGKTGDKKFVEKTVTIDDLRNVFRVELNLKADRLNSTSSFAERSAYFDRAQKKEELFDQRALYEELTGDEALVRRTMLPTEVVKQRQEQMAQAKILNQQAQAITQNKESQEMQAEAGMMGAPQTELENRTV